MSASAGWYDDGQGRLRWWDGAQWTDSYAASATDTGSAPPPSGTAPKNLWGVLSLIAGIVGILLAWIIFGGVVGIAGVVFGLVGLSAVRSGRATNRAMSIWGVILSGVAILMSIAFVVVYISFGAWLASDGSSSAETSGPGTGSEVSSAPETPEEPAPSDYEFPIGDGLTMEVSISAVQLDPPHGIGGDEPTQDDYDFEWGNAQQTDGQLAVVNMTIHNNNASAMSPPPGTVSLLKAEDFTEVTVWDRPSDGYGLPLIGGDEIPAGESVSSKMGFVLPASEIDTVVVESILVRDSGTKRYAAVQPQPGEGCAERGASADAPFEVWSCLQKE